MWVVSLIPLVIVILRLYVRIKIKGVFGWDDGIVIVATVRTSYLSVWIPAVACADMLFEGMPCCLCCCLQRSCEYRTVEAS